MSYTDEQMVIASQIAYMDFINEDYLYSGSYTIMELLERETLVGSEKHKEDAADLIRRIQEGSSTQECGNWRLRDIRNDQHGSGMYACVVETGEGEAIIAFRGSESDTLENKIKDWGVSDFGLLNNVLTPQQAAAEKYMKDIYKKYGDQYNSFGVTGHSLGGNLAEHATITASDGMRNKIDQCVNLDGPGFSNNYMIAHASDINKSKGIITHYQWSLVGTLLNPVPGSRYQTVQADTPNKESYLSSVVWRHDTHNVNYDEYGNVINGSKDELAAIADPISKQLDFSIFTALPILALNAVVLNNLDKLRDTFVNLWEQWQEIRNGIQDAQFEVKPDTLNMRLGQLEDTSAKLNRISEEVEQIRKQLEYDSLAAGYIKLKLWSISNKIENDADKIGGFCETGIECSQYYSACENKIAGNYA